MFNIMDMPKKIEYVWDETFKKYRHTITHKLISKKQYKWLK